MQRLERFDLCRILRLRHALRRRPLLAVLVMLLLLIRELPDDKDDQMDGDEQVRRREPRAKELPEARDRGGQRPGSSRDGGPGCCAEGEDAEEAKSDLGGPNRGSVSIFLRIPSRIRHLREQSYEEQENARSQERLKKKKIQYDAKSNSRRVPLASENGREPGNPRSLAGFERKG